MSIALGGVLRNFTSQPKISKNSLMAAAFVFTLPASPLLHAHEYWLAPTESIVKVGDVLSLDIRNGENFGGRAFPCVANKIASVRVYSPDGVDTTHCKDGAFPAIKVKTNAAGIYTVYTVSTERHVTYHDLEKFSEFLEYNGLVDKLSMHLERQLPREGIKERFYRYAKAIVNVRDGDVVNEFDPSKVQATLSFDFQMLDNPFAGSDELVVRLVRDGMVVSGHQISVFNKNGDQSSRMLYTTDKKGLATVNIGNKGKYLLNAVFMNIPKRTDVHWETQWTSLTFSK